MKKAIKKKTLPKGLAPEKLRWECSEDVFKFRCTSDISTEVGIIGQARAIHAIKTGLEIKHPGYNIFVSGLTGTGRSSTIKDILKRLDRRKKVPDDILYVQNFKDPDQPRLIRLPHGQGRRFRKDMNELVEYLKKHLPAIFESDEYKNKIEEVTEVFRSQERQLFQDFEQLVADAGFSVVRIQMGNFTRPDLLPLVDDKPVSFQNLENLVAENKFPAEKFEQLQADYPQLKSKLDKVLSQSRNLERSLKAEVEKTVRGFGSPFIESVLDDLRKRYQSEAVNIYLDQIRDYTLDSLELFLKKEPNPAENPLLPAPTIQQDPFHLYRVNLVVDNSARTHSPVIIETAPNFKNLFGTIEKIIDRSGNWISDFMNIKAGSVLRANGGFLVLNLLEAISEPWVWPTLKRTLKYGQLEIESPEANYLFGQSALKPEPIELNIKIVLIGDKRHYFLLYNYDEDFKKIFKISADFSEVMDRTKDHIQDYACFIKNLTESEGILPFSPSGVAAIVEESIRMADNQNKLSAKFSDVADLIREAGYWARIDKQELVHRKHVLRAIKEQIYRRNLIEERLREYISEKIIMIDTSGKKVGQINGLAVYDYGDYSFGKPARITATISLGKAGIINIEREAELSGKIHDKGIQILTGFLRQRFAQDKPLALTATICFEQSYGGIDGDSASSTELYLLLSSLANLPVRQDIAVTGSVNQIGQIQPIGGVNQKIEGFFDVCRQRRLTGTQGVIIPHQNVKDLQLRPVVVDAVKRGKFHVWPVKTIDEGIEILTGVKSGKKLPDGNWEKGTVNYLVNKKLEELALGIQKFYAAHEDTPREKPEHPEKEPIAPPPPPKQPTRKEDDEGRRS